MRSQGWELHITLVCTPGYIKLRSWQTPWSAPYSSLECRARLCRVPPVQYGHQHSSVWSPIGLISHCHLVKLLYSVFINDLSLGYPLACKEGDSVSVYWCPPEDTSTTLHHYTTTPLHHYTTTLLNYYTTTLPQDHLMDHC